MSRKMTIYLADLLHTGHKSSREHVPIAPGYIAAAANKKYPDTDIRIFRDPRFLLEGVRSNKPDIIGFSVYAWSERLSSFIAKKVEEISPSTIIVAGGPSVDDIDEEIMNFIKAFQYYDLIVPNEGEISFIHIIEHIKANGKLIPDVTIDGCARLASDGSLIRGKYEYPDLKKLPSPYLDGWMKPFLREGYLPILQTMRGCPYRCTYCCSGSKVCNKIRAFDLDRAIAEFEYIKKYAKRSYLFLTDENLGLFKDRDLRLARHIRKSYDKAKYPSYIDTYTDKHATGHILKINELLNPMRAFNVSFQTMNEEARKCAGRVNVSKEDYLRCLKWARERNMLTSTEMIFGFSGETADSFINSLEWLIKARFDRIYSYELRLLRGSDLFTKAFREEYKFKTKFRMTENSFGVYEDNVVVDMEEVVIKSSSFDFNDFIRVRKYGFFFFIVYGVKYLSELIIIMNNLGLHGEKLVKFLTDYDYTKKPRLNTIYKDYNKRIMDELFDSPDELTEYISQFISKGKRVPATKLNMIYAGKIMFGAQTRDDFFDIVKEFILDQCTDKKIVKFLFDYVDILIKQIVDFNGGEESVTNIKTNIDIERIERGNYRHVDELVTEQKNSVQLLLDDEIVKYTKKNRLTDLDNEVLLEDIFMTNSMWLKRKAKVSKSCGT